MTHIVAKRERRKPEKEQPRGSFLLVDDPFETPRINRDGSLEQPKRVVAANLRDDRLGYMFSRKQISQAQYAAGRKWQLVYERSTLARIRGMDPTREKVDVSSRADPLTASVQAAMEAYDYARAQLGTRAPLVFAVLADGKTLRQIAGEESNWYQVKLLMQDFRAALDVLAGLWGFAPMPDATPKRKSKIRSWRKEEG